jgi:hypothetical protein
MVQHCNLCWDRFLLSLQPYVVFISLQQVGEFFVYLRKVLGGSSAALKSFSLLLQDKNLCSKFFCRGISRR